MSTGGYKMKKILSLFILSLVLLSPFSIFAKEEKIYEVPVDMMHYSRIPGKKSMGTNAIKHRATVTERDGKAYYQLEYKPMEFMNLTGELTNLFIYEGDGNSNRVEANKKPLSGEYTTEFSFTRNRLKEDEIIIAVWVDAMDGLSGGEPGSGAGEQKSILTFDWNNAKEISGKNQGLLDNIGKKEEEKPSGVLDKIGNDPKVSTDKAIRIIVNGKEIEPETPAFIENERTMVPLRFISEALGLKVGWDNDTRTVTVGEGVTLTIDSKEITKGDGSILEIDAPAMIKNERTFVPLRAIAEISGAEVHWEHSTRTVQVNK